MRLYLIAALGRNRVIGKDNRLPWHLPDDLKRFKELTLGKPVIMGRKTFESLGKSLPGRVNIVLTRNLGFRARDCLVAHSVPEAVALAAEHGPEAFVIGGARVFEEFLPFADRLYLTVVEAELPGDTFFPAFEHLGFREIERRRRPADERHAFPFTFLVLERERDPGIK